MQRMKYYGLRGCWAGPTTTVASTRHCGALRRSEEYRSRTQAPHIASSGRRRRVGKRPPAQAVTRTVTSAVASAAAKSAARFCLRAATCSPMAAGGSAGAEACAAAMWELKIRRADQSVADVCMEVR